MTKLRPKVRLQVRTLLLLLLLIGLLFAASRASAASLGLRYSGRLVQPDGAPRSGSVSFDVAFFRSATGGSPFAAKQSFAEVAFKDGVFELPLQFAPADFHALFADEQEVWIELKDLATGMTLPRQKIEAVPYARKVPVDGATIAFDSDGKLTVVGIATAQVSGLSSALSSKVETADLTTLLASKADQATMTTTLAGKADQAAMTTALAGKADASHAHTLVGDVSGDLSTTTVTKLQGVPVDSTAPSANGQVLKWDGSKWAPGPDDGGVAGAVNNGANLGTGSGIFKSVAAPNLEFRSLTAGANISLTTDTNDVAIATTPSLTSSAQAGFVAAPYGTAAGNTGELRFQELAAGGANFVALKAPDILAADVTYTLPSGAPASNGQVLSGSTAGALTWTSLPSALPPSGSAGGSLVGSYPNPTIAANAVTAAEIAANAVDTSELNDGAVTSTKLAAGAVTTAKLAAGAVTTTELGADAVTTAKIAADTIVAADVAPDAVTASEIAAGAVGTSELAADAVTSAKIQDGQVQTADLAAGAVTTNEIADGSIAAIDLASDAVTNAKLADNAVNTAEIADGAVTNAKLASGIDGSKITAGSIPLAQVPTMVASGAAHAPGLVPDPPAASGTLRLLREDASWAIPSSLSASDGSPSQALIVDTAGNVGIGTTSPSSQLEIYGTSAQTTANLADGGSTGGILALNGGSSAVGNGGGLTFGNSQSKAAGSIGMAAIKALLTNGAGNTQGDLAFSTRTNTSDAALTERMRITSSGNVGIGTTTPASTLQVDGSVAMRVVAKSSNYTLTGSDHVVIADATSGALTMTLPTAVGVTGRFYTVKKTDASANAITVATTGGQTIDGAATVALPARYSFVTVISDGGGWSVVGSNATSSLNTACTKIVTTSLSIANPLSISLTVSYAMYGGGGGGYSASSNGGGGGGSSAILLDGALQAHGE